MYYFNQDKFYLILEDTSKTFLFISPIRLYTDIPWRENSGMKDTLTYDYFGINTKVEWKTAKEDLPAFINH